ncbi:hypothetical protein HK104_006557, partial [Borealophlyctis nickersoniae]
MGASDKQPVGEEEKERRRRSTAVMLNISPEARALANKKQADSQKVNGMLDYLGGKERPVKGGSISIYTEGKGRPLTLPFQEDWFLPVRPETVTVTVYVDDEEVNREPLWDTCRVKIGVKAGTEEHFFQLRNAKAERAEAKWIKLWEAK